MYARYPYPEPIEKGVQLVMSRQRPVSFAPLCLILQLPFTWLIRLFFLRRTAHGLKKQLRAYLTKIALSHTLYSSSHSQFGCWAKRIDIWQNSNPARFEAKTIEQGGHH